jgi:hypothetical protein
MQISSLVQMDSGLKERANKYMRDSGLLLPCGICNSPDGNCPLSHNRFDGILCTFFRNTQLSPEKICLILYCFLNQFSVKDSYTIIRDILSPAKLSVRTITTQFKKLRKLILVHVTQETSSLILPGPVEIDECMLFRQKKGYESRGRPYRNQVWIFGIKCRTTKRFILYILRSRKRSEIVPIILRHVASGAWIYSDCFGAYINTRTKESFLEPFGYTHLYINHSLHFVNPLISSIHTNTIERLWRDARSYMRLRQPRVFFNEYLATYYFFQSQSKRDQEEIIMQYIRRA